MVPSQQVSSQLLGLYPGLCLSPLKLLLRLCFRHLSTSFGITAILCQQLVLFPLARLLF